MDLRSKQLAHDLRMPIQLIYSCVQLLEMEISPNARAEGYLQMLTRSADQMRSMVRAALDTPRDEAQLQLRDVVADARMASRQCALIAGQKDVRVHFETNAARFLMDVDGEKLKRILDNLLSNALRFSPPGGHIGVRVQARGDDVELAVKDDGCGIAEDQQRMIFEQGVSEGGHGYGLSIAREYARQLGGEVRVRSAIGKGSQFTLRLPVSGHA